MTGISTLVARRRVSIIALPLLSTYPHPSREMLNQRYIYLGLSEVIDFFDSISSTYDHRVWKTGLPVRSAVLKPHAGELVVWWVTTCESSLLYVFVFFFLVTSDSRFQVLWCESKSNNNLRSHNIAVTLSSPFAFKRHQS